MIYFKATGRHATATKDEVITTGTVSIQSSVAIATNATVTVSGIFMTAS